jgi:hypothetical protein
MAISSIPKLFQPIRVGTADLQHRVVMAPMARFRADAQHVHGPLALEYYKQRTSVPGTLAITEGTIIAAQAGGYRNVPGIWSDEQISGWLKVRRLLPFPPQRHGWFKFLSSLLTYLRMTSPTTFSLPTLFTFTFKADRRRCAQKWLVHLPPAPSARSHRVPRRSTRRRRVPSRRAESDPTPTPAHQKQKRHVLTTTATRSTRTNSGGDRGVCAAVRYGSSECCSWCRV